jgi:hypothetical protein
MRSPKISPKRVLGLTLAAALAVTGTIALASSSEAAVGKAVITPATGPEGVAGKVITVTGTGFKLGTTVKVSPAASSGVQFSLATCGLTVGTTGAGLLDATARTVVSATKMVVTVPSLDLAVAPVTSQKWNVCIYDTASTPALMSTGTYTSLPAPTITAANSPASGSVAGGDVITVSGTGLTKTTKVKFGTQLSTKVTVAADGLSLTAVAPSAAAGAVAVSVITDGGTNATPATPAWDDYTYQNAIVLSPASGDGTAGNVIDISGVGFSSLLPAASVVFTRAGMTSITDDLTKCTDVQVVSDTELICTTPLLDGSGAAAPNGAFIVVVTADDAKYMADATAANRPAFETVLSSGAAYAAAPF